MQTNISQFKDIHVLCLDKIDKVISNVLNPTTMLQEIMDIVFDTFECDRAYIIYPCSLIFDTWSPIERSKEEYPGVSSLGQTLFVTESITAICEILLQHDDVIAFGPQTAYPIPEDLQTTFDIQSQLAFLVKPLNDNPSNFGIQQCSYPRVWTDEEKTLLYEIGLRISKALSK